MKKVSYRNLAPCLFAAFVDVVGFGLVLPVLAVLFTSPEADFFQENVSETFRYACLAVSFFLYPLFMLFGSSFFGDLSDIVGRKKVLILAMVGFGIGFGVTGIGIREHSLWILFIGRAFSGLMAASLPTVLAAIADMSTPETKAQNMSLVALVEALGFVTGPLIGGVLGDPGILPAFDMASPFFLATIMGAAAAIWLAVSFEDSYQPNPDKKIRFSRVFTVFLEAYGHPRIRVLGLAFLLMQMGMSFLVQLLPIYMAQTFGYGPLMVGLFNGFLGLWLALGVVAIVPFVAKRYQIEWAACWMLLLQGICMVGISFMSGELALWLMVIPMGALSQTAFSAMLTSFSNAVDEDHQGWALGISAAIMALSWVLTGISPDLIPTVGAMPLIFLGGIFFLFAFIGMFFYCRCFISSSRTLKSP